MDETTTRGEVQTFSSPAGYAICREILKKFLPFSPHDYQLEGVTKLLDGIDLLAVAAPGAGKSAYIFMTMLIMRELAKDPSLFKTERRFPKDPVMLMVYPTTALEEDQARSMKKCGLSVVVINKDTVQECEKQGLNIWKAAAERSTTIILLSPEMLSNPSFAKLIIDDEFRDRICAMGVDEIHLLATWGKTFRKEFLLLGTWRSRLPETAVFLAMTATLRPGEKGKSICELLGLKMELKPYHKIVRSNARRDIRLIFRTTTRMSSAADEFPEYDWIISHPSQVLVFVPTISVGFRLAVYLWHRDPATAASGRVRLFNAVHSSEYNEQTLEILYDGHKPQVVVSTDKMSVGVNIGQLQTVVVVDPSDLEDLWQKVGRVGRNRATSGTPTAYVYIPKSVVAAVKKHAAKKDASVSGVVDEEGQKVDDGMARMIMADCKHEAIDELYENTVNQQCSPHCSTCKQFPPLENPADCLCSGPHCQPETTTTITRTNKRRRALPPMDIRLTPAMNKIAVKDLKALREQLWEDADEESAALLPLDYYLPDRTIASIVDEMGHSLAKEKIAPLLTNGATSDVDGCKHLLSSFTESSSVLAENATLLLETLWKLHIQFDKMRSDAEAITTSTDPSTKIVLRIDTRNLYATLVPTARLTLAESN